MKRRVVSHPSALHVSPLLVSILTQVLIRQCLWLVAISQYCPRVGEVTDLMCPLGLLSIVDSTIHVWDYSDIVPAQRERVRVREREREREGERVRERNCDTVTI
jgi:hypothetical protein